MKYFLTVLMIMMGSHARIAMGASPKLPLATQGAGTCERITRIKVTKLSDDGRRGTLRHAVHSEQRDLSAQRKKSCRHVTFDVEGEIILTAPLVIRSDFITVDGCSAPGRGITLTQSPDQPYGLIIDGTQRHTHDILLQCLRFLGVQKRLKRHKVGEAPLSVDGDCASTKLRCAPAWSTLDTNGGVSRIAFDRLSFGQATDKLTLWGKVKRVSITRSLFYQNPLALLISFYNGPTDLEKRDIAIYRNIFTQNNERNPQVRGWVRTMDIRHNIIHRWDAFPPLPDTNGYPGDGYGIRIKNVAGEKSVDANIAENVFLGNAATAHRSLIYGMQPGRDRDEGSVSPDHPQNQQHENASMHHQMGKLYVQGNHLPDANMDQYSTIDAPLTTDNTGKAVVLSELCESLAREVGAPVRTTIENDLLRAVKTDCLAALIE